MSSDDRHEGNLFTLSRKIMDEKHWVRKLNNDQFRVFVTIVAEANWKDVEKFDGREMVRVNRGELITSFEILADISNVSVRTLRTTLKLFENAEFLTRESTRRGTRITLCNYERYQFPLEGKRHTERHAERHQADTPTVSQPAPEVPTKNTKYPETEKTEDEVATSSKAKASKGRPSEVDPARFEAAYQRYPRKQGKAEGMAKAIKNIRTEEEFKRFGRAIVWMEKAWAGFETDKCPYFSSFVHQKLWQDEVPPLPTKDTPRKTQIKDGAVASPPRGKRPSEIDAEARAQAGES